MLHCSNCRQNLTAYLENTLDPKTRAQVVAHLAGCPECSRELRRETAIREALHGIGMQPAPVDLRARVRAAVEAEQAHKPSLWSGWLTSFSRMGRNLTWAGGATALACMLLLVVRSNPELLERPATQMAQAPEAAEPLSQDQAADSVAEAAKQARSASPAAKPAKTTPAAKKSAPGSAKLLAKDVPAIAPRVANRRLEAEPDTPPAREVFREPRQEPVTPSLQLRHRSVRGKAAPVATPKATTEAVVIAGAASAATKVFKRVTPNAGATQKPAPVTGTEPAAGGTAESGNSLFMAKIPPPTESTANDATRMAATANSAQSPTVGEAPAAPITAMVAPATVFTVAVSWEGSAPSSAGGRVSIMARKHGFTDPTPGAKTPDNLAPVTNAAPLRSSEPGNSAMMARSATENRMPASANGNLGGSTAAQLKSADSAPLAELNTRRLRFVVTPQRDITDARVRVQLPANGTTSASESVVWTGNAVQNQPITATWTPPRNSGELPPLSVTLEQVGADERSRTLQTQIVVVPPQPSAATK